MSATHKIVNGVNVPLSPEEAAAIEAEWAANPPLTTQQMLAALRARAVALLASEQAEDARLMRGVLLTVLDEVNALRQWLTDFKAATAAATSLADLKTSVAALPVLAQWTPAQVRTAIGNKITAGDADS